MSVLIQRGVHAIEVLAVVIPGGLVLETADWPYRILVGHPPRLARSLRRGREILVAPDIVRAVALQAALLASPELGILVLIRTFLRRRYELGYCN